VRFNSIGLLVIDLFENSLRNNYPVAVMQDPVRLERQIFYFSEIPNGHWCVWDFKPEDVKAVGNDPELFFDVVMSTSAIFSDAVRPRIYSTRSATGG
jgi:hypothetical protein